MIIGIDASRANLQQKTGVEWYSYHLIRSLVPINPTLQYHLYTQSPLDPSLTGFGSHCKERVLSWPLPRFWTQGRLSLEMLICPPDALLIPASAIPLIHPKKTIAVIHDIAFEKYPQLYEKSQLQYLRWSTRYAIKKACQIITISHFSKNELVERYTADPKKIHVVHLGYDAKIFQKQRMNETFTSVLNRYKIQKPYILYIGYLSKKKNLRRLITAFSYLRNSPSIGREFRLVLVGKHAYGYDEIAAAIQGSGCEEHILQLGWIPEEDLSCIISGAEILAFPSFYEGFGLPVLEAMACGVPVIAACAGALPEIGGDAAYFVEPHDTKGWYQAIKQILEDPDLRENLVQKGRERIKDFSWKKCAQQTLEIILNS